MGIVRDSGGEYSALPKRCTHLVVTEKARHTPQCTICYLSYDVLPMLTDSIGTQAFGEGVAIVSLAWLLNSSHPSEVNKCLLEDGYKFKPHIEGNNDNQGETSITDRSRKKLENGGSAFKEQNTSVQDCPDGKLCT